MFIRVYCVGVWHWKGMPWDDIWLVRWVFPPNSPRTSQPDHPWAMRESVVFKNKTNTHSLSVTLPASNSLCIHRHTTHVNVLLHHCPLRQFQFHLLVTLEGPSLLQLNLVGRAEREIFHRPDRPLKEHLGTAEENPYSFAEDIDLPLGRVPSVVALRLAHTQ